MKNRIPQWIVQEADDLSKETGIPFRTLVETLYEAEMRKQEQPIIDYQPTLILVRT